MSEQVERARPGLSAWQAESLRLTAFPAEGASPQQLAEWPGWEATLGNPPENSATRERGQLIREDGAFEVNWLSFTRQPARLEWVFQPSFDPSQETMVLPSLGSFVEVFPPFQEAMVRWLAVAPPLDRLAFGAVLSLPVTQREAAYDILGAMLPVHLDPATSRDFMYQINRPRASASHGVENLEINRLSKWGCVRFAIVKMTIAGGAQSLSQSDPDYCCRLELDINTPAEYPGALPSEGHTGLFRELVGMACEIAQEGDVP